MTFQEILTSVRERIGAEWKTYADTWKLSEARKRQMFETTVQNMAMQAYGRPASDAEMVEAQIRYRLAVERSKPLWVVNMAELKAAGVTLEDIEAQCADGIPDHLSSLVHVITSKE